MPYCGKGILNRWIKIKKRKQSLHLFTSHIFIDCFSAKITEQSLRTLDSQTILGLIDGRGLATDALKISIILGTHTYLSNDSLVFITFVSVFYLISDTFLKKGCKK